MSLQKLIFVFLVGLVISILGISVFHLMGLSLQEEENENILSQIETIKEEPVEQSKKQLSYYNEENERITEIPESFFEENEFTESNEVEFSPAPTTLLTKKETKMSEEKPKKNKVDKEIKRNTKKESSWGEPVKAETQKETDPQISSGKKTTTDVSAKPTESSEGSGGVAGKTENSNFSGGQAGKKTSSNGSGYSTGAKPKIKIKTNRRPVNFKKLYRKNHHFIGWLKVPGTKINTAVTKHPTNNEFYLKRNFYKKKSSYGSIYADCRSEEEFGNHTIIYGHHMRNGTMFAGLDSFISSSKTSRVKTFSFDTRYDKQKFDIIGVIRTTTSSKVMNYNKYGNLRSKKAYDKYISLVKKKSIYHSKIKPKYGQPIVTLCTCSYHAKNGRILVIGVCRK